MIMEDGIAWPCIPWSMNSGGCSVLSVDWAVVLPGGCPWMILCDKPLSNSSAGWLLRNRVLLPSQGSLILRTW
ncbi:hypothetical protein K0M31_002221 [Melipona bicolor]|uniref:Uncharacterized protein n=1 Tax=Melipona bicolor TaxID=60889 RepID=A0AA40FS94_9HYME|nr:hypothetical protein K0M31_006655 [Melipona bicolor]KAK1137727.1 hypothetical protein K0M31_002221 [Melipona bicolor]